MIYNPLDKNYKSIIGACSESDKIKFRVKGDFDSVFMMLKKDGENDYTLIKMDKEEEYFSIELQFSVGLYFYHFELSNGRYICCSELKNGVILDRIEDFQLTSYSNDFSTPDWFKGGVIYQIFPDRFYSFNKDKKVPNYKILRKDWGGIPTYLPNEKGEVLNNDFFGGDINGIISKLDYLKDLGISVIYLNPIFEAYSNHRYDTGNYFNIDSLLGDLNDFKNLISECKNRNINVVLDGVFNHVGADSIYFNKYSNYDSCGAYNSKISPYYNWFNFTNYPNEYESWWGIKTLPAINENDAEFQEYITGINGVIAYYTKLGVAGWRLDVVDELPSEFVKKIRNACKVINKDSIVIGEVWEDASNKISYGNRREYFQGRELDSVMNYPLKNAIIDFVLNKDCNKLLQVIYTQLDHYPKIVLDCLMNMLSTHDTFRILSALSGEDFSFKTKTEQSSFRIDLSKIESAILNVKIASLIQFTLYGVPSIYYGDEIGMQGLTDPFNRGCFEWDNINNELLDWFKFLSKTRKEFSAFVDGETQIIYANKGVFLFKRVSKNSEILVGVNLSDKIVNLDFDGELFNLITNKSHSDNYQMKQYDFVIFYKISH